MDDLEDLEWRAWTDGAAALALAERKLLGYDTTPNSRDALAAVKRSAALGDEHGRRALIYLTASGIGRPADPAKARAMLTELAKSDRFAAVQEQFLGHVTCESKLAEVAPEVISADPYIAIYRGLFSAAECRYLMILGRPWLETASILGDDGQEHIDTVRDAQACSIGSLTEDLVVQAVNRTIAAATRTTVGWGEPLNIISYSPGQQYRMHHDGTGSDRVSVRNQTALIWLNDGYTGGETDFPRIKVRFRGAIGDMLVFHNVRANGTLDERMIHAGLPVTSGIKWLASRWIRGEDYLRG